MSELAPAAVGKKKKKIFRGNSNKLELTLAILLFSKMYLLNVLFIVMIPTDGNLLQDYEYFKSEYI